MTFDLGATLSTAVLVIASVIGYLLDRKDAAQQKEISDLKVAHAKDIERLTKLHEEDAQALQTLQVKLAAEHYPKGEVDNIMQGLYRYLDEKFQDLYRVIGARGGN